MRMLQNSRKYSAHNRKRETPCDKNCVQLKFNICEGIYHMVQTAQK